MITSTFKRPDEVLSTLTPILEELKRAPFSALKYA